MLENEEIGFFPAQQEDDAVTCTAVGKVGIVGTGGTEGRSITSKLGANANVNSGADGAGTVVGVVKPDANEAIIEWADLARRSAPAPGVEVPWWFLE